MKTRYKISLLLSLALVLVSASLVSALPNGAEVTFIESTTYGGSGATNANHSAIAGNLTELLISGASITQSWQGYYGNVTGGLNLMDATGNTFYNWTGAGSTGEIFASVNDSITWTNIQCFNFSAQGTYVDDSGQAGNTSYYGMNASEANSDYGISDNSADSLNATFSLSDHSEFYVNNLQFTSGECQNTRILNSTGEGIFEEVLLYSPDDQEIVFTSLIQKNTLGFDGSPHDFQMLVLEDGHGADTSTTDYYFYLEID